jgi:hypothetical protein
MKRLILKIKIEDRAKVEKFEMPAEQALINLLPNLVRGLGLDEKNGNGTKYWLETDTGMLDSQKSLAQLDIKNETLLYLKSGASIPKAKPKGPKPFTGEFLEDKPSSA